MVTLEHRPKIDIDSIVPDDHPIWQGLDQPQDRTRKRQESYLLEPKNEYGGCWKFGLTIDGDPKSERRQEAGGCQAHADLKAIAGLGADVSFANRTGVRQNLGKNVVQQTLGERNGEGGIRAAHIGEPGLDLLTDEPGDPFTHGALRAHLRPSGRRPFGKTIGLTVA
jgi:hypothetical protein